MKPWKRLRLLLAGLAIGTFAALLIAPSTRWIVREQVSNVFLANPDWAPISDRVSNETAQRNPNDYRVQLSAALGNRGGRYTGLGDEQYQADRMRKLDALKSAFPSNPSLYANLLRLSAENGFVEFRDQHNLDNLKSFPKDQNPFSVISLTDQLAAFDRNAATGESLDPDNGYFPLSRAAGLFTAHRDSEALAALHRAAGKAHWEDYHGDSIAGQWTLQTQVTDANDAMMKHLTLYQNEVMDYFALGFTSRFAAMAAAKAETTGHPEIGWQIRQDLMRCSGLMRTHSTSYYNTLYALRFAEMAMDRPGGAPSLDKDRNRNEDHLSKRYLDNFHAYLQKTGHGKDIGPMQAEYAAHQKIRTIYLNSAAINQLRTNDLPKLWVMDLLILGNCFWMFVAGSIALLLARNRRIQSGKSMSRDENWSIAAGILLGITLLLWYIVQRFPSNPDIEWLLGEAILIPVLYLSMAFSCLSIATLILVGLGSFRDKTLRYLGIYAVTLVSVVIFDSLVFLEARRAKIIFGSYEGLSGPRNLNNGPSDLFLLCAGCAVALLVLVVITGFVFSLKRGIPLSVGLTRTFGSVSIPMACVALVIYGGMVLGTLQEERRANYDLDRQIQNEGKYRAELIGQTWPGPTNWDTAATR